MPCWYPGCLLTDDSHDTPLLSSPFKRLRLARCRHTTPDTRGSHPTLRRPSLYFPSRARRLYSFSFERRRGRSSESGRRRWLVQGRRRQSWSFRTTRRRARGCRRRLPPRSSPKPSMSGRRRRGGPKTKTKMSRGRTGSPTASAWRATNKTTARSRRRYVHPTYI